MMIQKKGLMKLIDELHKGQAFIGQDDNKYYFLGLDYNEQILFTNLDLWTDKEQKYIEKSNLFIKEILAEESSIIKDSSWYYQSKKELERDSTNEKVKRCLDIIENANTYEFELKPISIDALVKGQAYSREFNQYYEVIGFIVNNNVYVDDRFKGSQKGFFSIYHSNCESSVPLIFERNYKSNDKSFDNKHFIAGNGDIVDIVDVILDKNIVNSSLDDTLKERFIKSEENDRCI